MQYFHILGVTARCFSKTCKVVKHRRKQGTRKFCIVVKKQQKETDFRGGFEYAWVDTCCIDKTSSSELSEAIDSMYRWYQEAGYAMCICLMFQMCRAYEASSSELKLL
jgi:hypothetical protein